jgi:hypothetical protein
MSDIDSSKSSTNNIAARPSIVAKSAEVAAKTVKTTKKSVKKVTKKVKEVFTQDDDESERYWKELNRKEKRRRAILQQTEEPFWTSLMHWDGTVVSVADRTLYAFVT